MDYQDLGPQANRLLAVIGALSSCHTIGAVMEIVRREARELSGADGVTFVLRDGDQCHYAEENAVGPLWKGRRFPMTACISGWVMRHRQVAAIEDIYADPRVPVDAYRPTFVKSLAMVPVRADDPIGAIGAYWAANHRASAAEIQVLQAFANASALAMENSRLYDNLQSALRRAEALNRAKDEWISVLSHELRTPLTPILGWTRMLQSADLDAGRRRHALEVIERNVNDEIRIVEDLLDVSRMMAGRMQIALRPCDARASVQAAVDRARTVADRKGVGVLVALPPDPVSIVGDGERLERAVWNLLANAVKFTPEGGRVELAVEQSHGQATIVVRDTGEGIPDEMLARVFERFERADWSMARADGGLGLGLFIVRQIVELHQGSVTAHSEGPGRGAVFAIHLPLNANAPHAGVPAPVHGPA